MAALSSTTNCSCSAVNLLQTTTCQPTEASREESRCAPIGQGRDSEKLAQVALVGDTGDADSGVGTVVGVKLQKRERERANTSTSAT